MTTNRKDKQFQAVVVTIAAGIQQQLNYYLPGKTIEYQVAYGDEGEDRWTRGKTEITEAHLEAAKRLIGIGQRAGEGKP